MTDKNIADVLLKMPRTSKVSVKPFTHRDLWAIFLRAVSFGSLMLFGLALISSFLFPMSFAFCIVVSLLVAAIVLTVSIVDGYRNETLRTIQLCAAFTGQVLPREAKIVKAALRIPFCIQRIELGEFEADLWTENSRGRSGYFVSKYHSKPTGTHHIQNYLVLKPGKVWFEQSSTVTFFGIMYRDFDKSNK